MSAEETASLFE